jgi:hypothetical protein
MRRETEDFASIDVAVTFFAAVLMLFALIQFNFTDNPPEERKASVGQSVETLTAIAPAWQTVATRSGVAIHEGDHLHILDMSQISIGVADRGKESQGSDGWTTWSQAGMAATPPNAFLLEIYTALASPPPTWIRHGFALGGDADCPNDLRPSLIVFVIADDVDLSPVLAFSDRCGIDVRFEFLRLGTDVDRIAIPLRIGLSPSAYRKERIFR